MVTAESPASRVGHITLGRKRAGKPIAGNRHDGFEVAGTGTQLTVWLVRHSQRKRGATDRLNLRSMAPVLDPTKVSGPSSWPRCWTKKAQLSKEDWASSISGFSVYANLIKTSVFYATCTQEIRGRHFCRFRKIWHSSFRKFWHA